MSQPEQPTVIELKERTEKSNAYEPTLCGKEDPGIYMYCTVTPGRAAKKIRAELTGGGCAPCEDCLARLVCNNAIAIRRHRRAQEVRV